MKTSPRLEGMQAFYALLGGQLISLIGSGMARFGLSIWVLSETGNTTAYTTMIFFAVFPAGLVLEIGELLTHGTVVAREYSIPAVVGVSDATHKIQTGQKIRVDGNSGFVILMQE